MSLYRSRAGSQLHGTEYESWANFVPVGKTEKKIWAVRSKKLNIISVITFFWDFVLVVLGLKIG